MKKFFDPSENILGGYTPMDGTVEFFGRIQSILKDDMIVLDLGAGRGAWFYEDKCEYRKQLRDIKAKSFHFIGVDVDPVVMNNQTTHKNYQMLDQGIIPLDDNSVDLIICDYVLEHIDDPLSFASEVSRVLKPGGYFTGRTPHKYGYIAIGARLFVNKYHNFVLKILQPQRKKEDVFPTRYRLNKIKDINKTFKNFKSFSYFYAAEPSYYMGNKYIYYFLNVLHKLLPSFFVGNIFVFLKKIN